MHSAPTLIAAILFWITSVLVMAAGADHWAFKPVPKITGEGVDAFIHAGLQKAKLSPAPPADRVTLIRRLYLDLHGLPPTPEQIAEFVAAKDERAAWSDMVDRLLASPRYGERWAQHWLDLVRYADTHGFEVNTERANAWPYRDYVIRAFNNDRPYDQFILDQLAGDFTGEDAATGFLVASAVLLPGQIGKDDASKRLARQDALDEIITATGDTFLAVSIGCARCHDHKFDPVSQKDYYAMQAFFAGVEYGERPLRNPALEAQLEAHGKKIQTIRKRLDGIEARASTTRILIIDDEDPEHSAHLVKKNGHGTNPAGTQRGYKDDPGGPERAPNLSRGRYTWWNNTPGEDVFTYDPKAAGTFRVWLSWGVHGSGVHTRDARYVLDRDGKLETRDDQAEIARADQYYFAGVSSGTTEKKPMWSGLLDAGVHTLTESSRIVLRGGETGTGITADVILLQESDEERASPGLRGPVHPARNVERFSPITAKFVRFTCFATINNDRHEPCIDELEIYTTEGNNVALGGQPGSSGNYADDGHHQLKHINDGQYGNSRSWISNERGKGWVQIELTEPALVDRIVWGRDRDEKYKDRLAEHYRIEVAVEPGAWTTVAHSDDRVPYGTPFDATAALMRKLPAGSADATRADLAELGKLEKELGTLESRLKVFAGTFRDPDMTYVLYRGDPEQQREPVHAAVPPSLGSLALGAAAPEQERRMALARWIASPDHPLTARVMVNRIWQWHFGRGLVDTASDFGLMGTRPSHPALLDWLAGKFVAEGWSVKQMHRLICNSSTYRQSNRIDPAAQKIDADDRLLGRFPSRRLEAEAIRDGILAVNGRLNLDMGGRGFDFFQSRGGLNGFPVVEQFSGQGLRRMIYAHKVRMERVPVFGAFDCPDAGQATPKRSRATTAIQALNLFNSAFIIEQAEAFAKRVEADTEGGAIEAQVQRAFLLALGRAPRPNERASALRTVEAHGLSTLCRVLYNCNEFLFLP